MRAAEEEADALQFGLPALASHDPRSGLVHFLFPGSGVQKTFSRILEPSRATR